MVNWHGTNGGVAWGGIMTSRCASRVQLIVMVLSFVVHIVSVVVVVLVVVVATARTVVLVFHRNGRCMWAVVVVMSLVNHRSRQSMLAVVKAPVVASMAVGRLASVRGDSCCRFELPCRERCPSVSPWWAYKVVR